MSPKLKILRPPRPANRKRFCPLCNHALPRPRLMKVHCSSSGYATYTSLRYMSACRKCEGGQTFEHLPTIHAQTQLALARDLQNYIQRWRRQHRKTTAQSAILLDLIIGLPFGTVDKKLARGRGSKDLAPITKLMWLLTEMPWLSKFVWGCPADLSALKALARKLNQAMGS